MLIFLSKASMSKTWPVSNAERYTLDRLLQQIILVHVNLWCIGVSVLKCRTNEAPKCNEHLEHSQKLSKVRKNPFVSLVKNVKINTWSASTATQSATEYLLVSTFGILVWNCQSTIMQWTFGKNLYSLKLSKCVSIINPYK